MCKQVSRLGFILLEHLPALQQWLRSSFVSFTVTGIARKFHPYSLDTLRCQRILRGYTRYSLVLILYRALKSSSSKFTLTLTSLPLFDIVEADLQGTSLGEVTCMRQAAARKCRETPTGRADPIGLRWALRQLSQ